MSRMRVATLAVLAVALGLIWPSASPAYHTTTSGTVSALLKERRSADSWTVELTYQVTCNGSSAGNTTFDGDLFLVDKETDERIYVGAVVSPMGPRTISGRRETYVTSRERSWPLTPELVITCFQTFPQDGGNSSTLSGSPVIIPPSFAGRGARPGAGGGPGGDYGSGDPTAPLGSGGCGDVLMGTGASETLTGTALGDVIFGLGGRDRIRGRRGHDCLIGGSGGDVLRGERGSDRLTGGRGRDVLVGGPGRNAYDAGPGNDYVNARNGKRELVRCGRGRDRARADRRDRLRSCERVSRSRR